MPGRPKPLPETCAGHSARLGPQIVAGRSTDGAPRVDYVSRLRAPPQWSAWQFGAAFSLVSGRGKRRRLPPRPTVPSLHTVAPADPAHRPLPTWEIMESADRAVDPPDEAPADAKGARDRPDPEPPLASAKASGMIAEMKLGQSSCAACFTLKKRCERVGDGPCVRCTRLNRTCEPADHSISRRRRERLRKAQRWKATHGRAAARPDARTNSEGRPSSPSTEDSPSPPPAADNRTPTPVQSYRPPAQPAVPAIPFQASPGIPAYPAAPMIMPFGGYVMPGRVPIHPFVNAMSQLEQNPAPGTALASFGDIATALFAINHPWSPANPDYMPEPVWPCPRPVAAPEDLRLDLIQPSVEQYWADYHPLSAILHRPSVEAALSGQGNPIYGAAKPAALLFAIAATGVQHLNMPDLSDADKVRITRAFSDRSRDFLLSACSAPAGMHRIMSDIEAAQTVLLLLQSLLVAGQASSSFHLLRQGAEIVHKLGFAPDRTGTQALICSDLEPLNPLEWIYTEIVVRLWIGLGSIDIPFAYYAGRDPLLDYHPAAFRLPCHDSFYCDPDVNKAFENYRKREHAGDRIVAMANFGPFIANPNHLTGAGLVTELIQPVFCHRASYLVGVLVMNYFRFMRLQLRKFAFSCGVDTLAMVAKRTEDFTLHEYTYRERVVLFETMVQALFQAMPRGTGIPLGNGDPAPFFAQAASCFAEESHLNMFLSFVGVVRACAMEHFIQGDPAAADPNLFLAPVFAPVLESGVAFVKMLEAQHARDPTLRWCHFVTSTSMLKIAAVNLASIGLLNRENAADEGERKRKVDESSFAYYLRVLLRHYEFLGRKYGLLSQKIAGNLRGAMLGAGVTPFSPPRTVTPDTPPIVLKAEEVVAEADDVVVERTKWLPTKVEENVAKVEDAVVKTEEKITKTEETVAEVKEAVKEALEPLKEAVNEEVKETVNEADEPVAQVDEAVDEVTPTDAAESFGEVNVNQGPGNDFADVFLTADRVLQSWTG